MGVKRTLSHFDSSSTVSFNDYNLATHVVKSPQGVFIENEDGNNEVILPSCLYNLTLFPQIVLLSVMPTKISYDSNYGIITASSGKHFIE